MEKFVGVIIEEIPNNKKVLEKANIVNNEIEEITEKHKTPWINKWTLHTVKISEDKAEEVAQEISKRLDKEHNWYADYKNEKTHYIIFKDKIFKISRTSKEQYDKATEY